MSVGAQGVGAQGVPAIGDGHARVDRCQRYRGGTSDSSNNIG
jgi:hypothetical protein